ncbi:MAG: TetR/AcrR family transcriptional regulator, partial [Alphaproteobacteria bacterium]|nr:TetR/AcrR family transcriptional regulator [Alphaproteobacteria bacterium]
MSDDRGRGKWIGAALATLGTGGVEAVRVETLAASLGVTKGGFYWHFKDRRALLDAVLAAWRDGRIATIAQQTAPLGPLGGPRRDRDPGKRLAALIRLYAERANAEGMAIELAIRQWARADTVAAAAVATVDHARLQRVAALYRALGASVRQAEARALLFYAFVFGQGLIGLPRDRRRRAALVA